MKATLSICGLLLLPLVQAHYKLLRPAPREFDTSKEGSGPCGGSTTPASNRSTWSLDGDTISLSMGHDHSRLQILLGLGNDPGNSFNIPILPTSQQEGMGALCLQSLRLPAGVNAMDGQNGTIQIITSNESGGGLYVCSDVTFSRNPATAGSCTNGTGQRLTPLTGNVRNANETQPTGSSSSASSNASSTGSNTASATQAGKTSGGSKADLQWTMGGLLVGASAYALFLL